MYNYYYCYYYYYTQLHANYGKGGGAHLLIQSNSHASTHNGEADVAERGKRSSAHVPSQFSITLLHNE